MTEQMLVCVCGSCRTCQARERQRRYRADPIERERLRANDRRRSQAPRRKAEVRVRVEDWQVRNPRKHKAHRAVANAVRRGKLVKGPCEQVGPDCCGQIEAHHDDYDKLLDVRWLCKEHHEREHHH